MTDTPIETLGDLLTLMTKPAAYKAKLAVLRKTIDKAEKATAKLETAGRRTPRRSPPTRQRWRRANNRCAIER